MEGKRKEGGRMEGKRAGREVGGAGYINRTKGRRDGRRESFTQEAFCEQQLCAMLSVLV